LTPNDASGASQVRGLNIHITQHMRRPVMVLLYGPIGVAAWVFACVHACVRVCVRACVRVCVNKSCNLNPSVLQITFRISVDAKGQSVLPVV
jgi:hypothetical protein